MIKAILDFMRGLREEHMEMDKDMRFFANIVWGIFGILGLILILAICGVIK